MGQEFVKAGAVPPWVGEVVLTAAAKAFSNSTQVDVYAPLPYFMNPVLAACQLVNVSKEGEQPALTDAQEDLRLFSSELVDKKGKNTGTLHCLMATSSFRHPPCSILHAGCKLKHPHVLQT